MGKKIIDTLSTLKIIKGTLTTIIAHPYALCRKKRFIEEDLNRSFPGNLKGKLEEKIAYNIMKEVKKTNYLIDIHSSTTDIQDAIIIKHQNKKIRKMLDIMKPRRAILMPKGIGDGSLINFFPQALSLEYGRHNSRRTYCRSLNDIKRMLRFFRMIKCKRLEKKKYKSNYYRVYDIEKKPKGFIMKRSLRNFKLVKRGELLGVIKNKEVFSQEDFYPVLFGPKSYPDIMGFNAKRLKRMI